jgi:hypothetical protein
MSQQMIAPLLFILEDLYSNPVIDPGYPNWGFSQSLQQIREYKYKAAQDLLVPHCFHFSLIYEYCKLQSELLKIH